MKKRLSHKTGELNGPSYFKCPLISNAISNIENDDKYCFIWSLLAYLHPCENDHPRRVLNYRQYFNELNIEGFDFSKGFKCSDVHEFEKLNSSSIYKFEKNFCQDKNKWKHNLIPIEISKNVPDRVVDLLKNKHHYALIKKRNLFLGDHHTKVICTLCLNSCTSENNLTLHKPKCENTDIFTIRTSHDSHLHWKNHFHKNPLYFRICTDIEADNEIDNSSTGNKTTKIYKQNPVFKDYHIESELEDVLQSSYYKSPLSYNNLDWFVDEVIKLENKMAFSVKDTKKNIIMTEKDEKEYRNNNNCRFFEINIESDEVRDHCHLTGR